ncbi:MAG: hypothetical protein V3W34_20720 [Phycisphaerae bacterium]
MSAAMAWPALAWLSWVSLLPLFLAIRFLPPLQALLAGGLWGLSLFVFAVAGFPTGVSPSVASLLLLTAVPGLYALAAGLVTRWIGYSAVVVAFGWIGVEFALQPLGLRHGLLAGTQAGGPVFAVVGKLLGYFLAAFVIALVNASLVSAIDHVRISASRQGLRIQSDQSQRCLAPQTSRSFGRFALRPSQPRAPPRCWLSP